EREQQPADERGDGAAGQLAGEQEHAEARQHERREEQQVVAEDRIARQRVDREDLHRLRHEMLRVGERQRRRVEDVGIEEMAEMRGVAREDAAQLLAVPRQDPDVEDRVAQVPGDVAREPFRERPRHAEGDDGVRRCRVPRARVRRAESKDHSSDVSFISSSNTTCRMAAVGTARIAPITPSSEPPISSALITTTGLMPTWRCMMFGTSRWFSSCCCAKKNAMTPSASVGFTDSATAIAGTADRIGPTIGIISPRPAMSAST